MAPGRSVEVGTDKMSARVQAGVGWLTYDNPSRLNALTTDMIAAIPRILTTFDTDPEVAVIVVTGAGQKAFIAGADVSEFGRQRSSAEGRARYDQALLDSWQAWDRVEKPVIAMIRGYCVGAGVITAIKADIRVAAEGSLFVLPAARLGLGYGFAGVRELMQLVGPTWTAEMIWSARRISAQDALGMGLVNRLVASDRIEEEVRELALMIAANAPMTVKACKAAIRQARLDPDARDLAGVDALVEACFRSEDYLEGQLAFREKRAPHFAGR